MSITPYSYSNIPVYRFYVSELSSVSYEVFPLKFLTTSLVDELEKNNVFYRRKFNGSLLFGTNSLVIDDTGVTQNRKDDWLLFWGQEQHDSCAKLYLTITKTVSGATATYWEGSFSTTDGKFDIDQCTFEVTPLPEDDYTSILDLVDTQYNILTGTVVTTTRRLDGVTDIVYTRNRWLRDTIDYLVLQIGGAGATVSTDFFDVTPNYVTQHASHLLYLTIAQKSDIIRPTSTDPATTAMMSWNELMDILWAMFQVTWDYDLATEVFTIEHISFFSGGAGIDLRTQLMTVATNKYSYLKGKMPKYEKFLFMEADDADFVGVPIWYNSQCVDPDPDTNIKETAINVTTDLDYIINSPDAISDEGFVILCNYLDGADYIVEIGGGAFMGHVLPNMHLSWANLHRRYYMHNRILITGQMNGDLTTFFTAQKTKQQQCSAIICADYDPSDEITTELGETYFGGAKAIVQHSELRPTGEVKFNLLYGPADNAEVEIDDEKWIIIQEVGLGHFHMTLSEAAGAGLTVIIQFIIWDSTGVAVCACQAGKTWTVTPGVTSEQWDLPASPPPPGDCNCDPADFPVGGCMEYPAITLGTWVAQGWTVHLITDKTYRC